MKSRRCALLLGLTALAGCVPGHYRVDAGAAFTALDGRIGLQNSSGTLVLADNMQDFSSNLGVGETETSPYVRAEADFGDHRIKASYLANHGTGTGTLGGAFGDIPAGTAVTTDVDFTNVTASWSYDLVPSSILRVAPGVQIGYYNFDISVRSTTPAAFETVNTDLIAPMPYLDVEVDLGIVDAGVNLGLMSANLRDATSRYTDAEAFARVTPFPGLELIAGYRYILMDAHGTASGRDFDADFTVQGLFIGGGIHF
jgi:hypothetical protein